MRGHVYVSHFPGLAKIRPPDMNPLPDPPTHPRRLSRVAPRIEAMGRGAMCRSVYRHRLSEGAIPMYESNQNNALLAVSWLEKVSSAF